jgi:multidrug efflux pump subunit AcrB
LKEYPISNLYDENSSANVGIVLSLEDKDKTNLQDIQNLKKKEAKEYDSNKRFGESKTDTLQKTIYRKDQKRVVYVTADMAGAMESQCMPFGND